MSQKQKNDIDAEELTFLEEVSDSELHSKLGTSDIIYKDVGFSKRTKVLIVFAVLLILSAICSALFGFIYLDKEVKDTKERINVVRYNLFVTHSSSSFGGNIESFENYNALNKAYSYSFSVKNDNSISLGYSIYFSSDDFVDKSLINYQLLRNGMVVQAGNFVNSDVNKIFDTKIKSNGYDKYEIKIWSLKVPKSTSFKFKIDVRV